LVGKQHRWWFTIFRMHRQGPTLTPHQIDDLANGERQPLVTLTGKSSRLRSSLTAVARL